MRTELQEDAAELTRQPARRFEPYVRGRVGEVVDEVDDGIDRHLGDSPPTLGPARRTPRRATACRSLAAPPLKSRRLETRLMMLLGAGFGLGVALTREPAVRRTGAGADRGRLVVGGLVGLLR